MNNPTRVLPRSTFQRYIMAKPPLPLDVDFDVQVGRCALLLLAGMSWCELVGAACSSSCTCCSRSCCAVGCQQEAVPNLSLHTMMQDLWDHLKLSPPRYDSYEAACAAVAEIEAAEAAAAASGLAAIEEDEESDGEGPDDAGDGGSEGGSDGEEDGESQGGGEAEEEEVARWGRGGKERGGLGSACRATRAVAWCYTCCMDGPTVAMQWAHHSPAQYPLPPLPQDGERGGGGGCAHGAPRLRHTSGGG